MYNPTDPYETDPKIVHLAYRLAQGMRLVFIATLVGLAAWGAYGWWLFLQAATL